MKSYLHELSLRLDLMKYLVLSGLKAQHKNSYLGFFWWLLDPLLQIFIYYFVVVVVFQKARGADYGIYLAIGLIVWRWLSSTVTSSVRSIISQAGLITQVYLPKVVFPACTVFSETINFLFGLLVVALCLAVFQIRPGAALVWLPPLVGVQFLFMMALALLIAYVSVYIRDVEMIIRHFMRLWFYGSPVIWYADMVPERARWVLKLNPMAGFLEAYRRVIIDNQAPDFLFLLGVGGVSALSVVILVDHYRRYEHHLIKIL